MAEFEQLGVQGWLARQCTYMAMRTPTPIQQQCIPAILSGRPPHLVGGAATGSGKTAAFAIPLIQLLSEDMYGVFALVLTPSRELAYQITDQFLAFGAPVRLRTMLAVGGTRHEDQLDAIKARPHIVVATPGRLLHLLTSFSQEVKRAFARLQFLVLDEADRLTEGDMSKDVRAILRELPAAANQRRRVLMFSATIEARLTAVKNATQAADGGGEGAEEEDALPALLGIRTQADLAIFMQSHGEHAVIGGGGDAARAAENKSNGVRDEDDADGEVTPQGSRATAASPTSGTTGPATEYHFPATLHQHYVFFPNMVKLPNLVATLRAQGPQQSTIVFVNSCHRAELVRLTLQLLGFPVCSLDSLLTQQKRIDNLALFKLGLSRVLVCTDIAARGLDIPDVNLVVHYDVPKHAATYVHRVGRTARAGREGLSVAFVTEYDVDLIQRIEKKTKVKCTLWKNPALRETRVLKVLDEVSAAKVQAMQEIDDQFGRRVQTLKDQAEQRRTERRVTQAPSRQPFSAREKPSSSTFSEVPVSASPSAALSVQLDDTMPSTIGRATRKRTRGLEAAVVDRRPDSADNKEVLSRSPPLKKRARTGEDAMASPRDASATGKKKRVKRSGATA